MNSIMESLYSGQGLSKQQARDVVNQIVKGTVSEVQISALLVALKMKGESADEIAGAANALRQSATPFPRPNGLLVDTCGTGGDGFGTLNISTVVGLVAAECGVKVAKHGNRSVSSKCGSSDVLQKFGVKLDITPAHASECLQQHNFCFLFAPLFHSGVKHVMPVRTELKTRTLFNLLGPLANPALPNVQLLGVYDASLLNTMADALNHLGCEKAFVVNGAGLDEIALHAATQVAYLNRGVIENITITPEDAGIKTAPLSQLQLSDPNDIAAALLCLAKGIGKKEHVDVVALNTAAVLFLCDYVKDLKQGAQMAYEAIYSGRVADRLAILSEFTNKNSEFKVDVRKESCNV